MGAFEHIDKDNYVKHRVRDANGRLRYSLHRDDAISRALFGMQIDELYDVAKANDLLTKYPKDYGKNFGHYRMMLGTTLRNIVKKGGSVKIGKHRITSLDQHIAIQEAAPTKANGPKAAKAAAKPVKGKATKGKQAKATKAKPRKGKASAATADTPA